MATVAANPYMFPQKTQDALLELCRQTRDATFHTMELRQRFEFIDREFIRENNLANKEQGQARIANYVGDKRKIQDIVIPVIEPQVSTAHSFLSSVFLSGNPIFGIVSDPTNEEQAMQMEAVISQNATYGGWAREISLFFLDTLKYNFAALEVDWCTEKTWSVITDTAFSKTQGKPKEITWQGNRIRRRDPYNILFDPRVPLTKQHTDAEFVGYSELMNRIGVVQYLQNLSFRMNYTKAMEAPQPIDISPQALYYIPSVFLQNYSYAKLAGMIDWNRWAFGNNSGDPRIQFKNLYILVTRYVRIIPKEFGMSVPASGQPQIWKLVTINDNVIVYMERQTNAHNYLPLIFGQATEDGLNLQTKSFAQKQIPFQDIASSLANSRFAARRRLIADRMLYDPSRIRSEDINSDSPTAKIPVRAAAYGQPLEKAVYPIPFRDEQTGTLMQDVREVKAYADNVSGQNPSQQGQFVKGNKTKSEYDDVQNNSSGRQKDMAILLEAQVFSPVKHIIKTNILQYQPAGPAYSFTDGKEYNINPVDLRNKVLVFQVSDGLMPSEKLIDGDTLNIALSMVAQSPQLAEEYSVGDIFAYLIGTRGVNLTPFKLTPQQIQQRNANMLAQAQAEGAGRAKGAALTNPTAPGEPDGDEPTATK